jgi:hypothetical protein
VFTSGSAGPLGLNQSMGQCKLPARGRESTVLKVNRSWFAGAFGEPDLNHSLAPALGRQLSEWLNPD